MLIHRLLRYIPPSPPKRSYPAKSSDNLPLHFLMSLSVPVRSIPDLLARLELLPPALQGRCHFLLRTAQFRSASTVFDQIEQLRSCLSLTWDHIAVLYHVPKSTIHKQWKAFRTEIERTQELPPTPTDPRASHANLSSRQEAELIQWIRERQKQSRCPTVHELREHAAEIATGSPDAEPFTKYWWRSFKRRHSQEIATEILDSREAARTKVKTEDVLAYFGRVCHALTQIRSLHQLINMDESGFSGRIDKGRKRKCVIAKDCTISPAFQEDEGSSQLTIVSTISASADALTPMFITKEVVKINHDFANDSIFARALHFCTKKGYQDESSMVYWIQNCLRPYVCIVQKNLGDENAPVFLIMDNCPSHNTL